MYFIKIVVVVCDRLLCRSKAFARVKVTLKIVIFLGVLKKQQTIIIDDAS